MTLIVLKPAQAPNGTWVILQDGHFMGDDRGFVSLEACKAEMQKRLAQDARDAVKYDRPPIFTSQA